MSYDSYEIPDAIEPLVGYRGWLVKPDFTLTSAYPDVRLTIWPVGEPLVAKCMPPPSKAATDQAGRFPTAPKHWISPHKECSCGIYALSNLPGGRMKPWPSDAIVGLVQGWGRMIIGTKGFRAEFARPVALVSHPRSTVRWPRIIEGVADKYGLEVIDLREIRNDDGHRDRRI